MVWIVRIFSTQVHKKYGFATIATFSTWDFLDFNPRGDDIGCVGHATSSTRITCRILGFGGRREVKFTKLPGIAQYASFAISPHLNNRVFLSKQGLSQELARMDEIHIVPEIETLAMDARRLGRELIDKRRSRLHIWRRARQLLHDPDEAALTEEIKRYADLGIESIKAWNHFSRAIEQLSDAGGADQARRILNDVMLQTGMNDPVAENQDPVEMIGYDQAPGWAVVAAHPSRKD